MFKQNLNISNKKIRLILNIHNNRISFESILYINSCQSLVGFHKAFYLNVQDLFCMSHYQSYFMLLNSLGFWRICYIFFLYFMCVMWFFTLELKMCFKLCFLKYSNDMIRKTLWNWFPYSSHNSFRSTIVYIFPLNLWKAFWNSSSFILKCWRTLLT